METINHGHTTSHDAANDSEFVSLDTVMQEQAASVEKTRNPMFLEAFDHCKPRLIASLGDYDLYVSNGHCSFGYHEQQPLNYAIVNRRYDVAEVFMSMAFQAKIRISELVRYEADEDVRQFETESTEH